MTRLTSLMLAFLAIGSVAHAQDSINSKTAWSSLDAIDQYTLLHNDDYRSMTNTTYIADALDDKLSALGRFGYATRCIAKEDIVQWAICQPDIDAFDAAKINAEIDADTKHKPAQHEALKQAVTAGTAAFAAHADKVKAFFAKDAAYKKLFDIAASTRTEWASKKQNASLRDLALAMDDARTTRSRKAMDGCEDKTWAAWKTAVGAIPAKRFSLVYKYVFTEVFVPAAAVIAGDPDGYLAAVALSACFSASGKPDVLVQYVTTSLLFWPGYRGPRNATELAIMQANVSLDDRDAKLTMPSIDRREMFTGDGNGGRLNHGGGGRAPIVSTKAEGDKTHLTFGPTKSVETQCTDYKAGKHLSRIESDGRLVYEGTCYKYAKVTVTHDAPKPIDTPTRYATGVKPGMTVTFIDNAVMLAVANLSATAPSAVFGVPVK